jgi:hypothetical protein
MRPSHAIAFVGLAFVASCTKKASHPPPAWWFGPPPQAQQQPQYGLPWSAPAGSGAAPVASASASAAPAAAPAANADFGKCMAESATTDDCKAAIESAKAAPGSPGVFDLYKRACEKKVKLLGCGAFKSTAISEGDHPTMELLMRCELGAAANCEQVKTKVAPLQAWLSTLKSDLCKKGENALCPDFHQCKKPAKWECAEAAGGTKACGCLAPCAGTRTVTATSATWPDGSARAAAVCTQTASP